MLFVRTRLNKPGAMRTGWFATAIGSGALLILIVVFAVTTRREAQRIYSDLTANDSTMQELEIQLSGLGSDIFQSGIYVRDQLLDSQSEQADDQRDLLKDIRESMELRLARITALVPDEQKARIQELREEIAHYWEFVAPVAEEPQRATRTEYAAVRKQMVERRDSSLAIAQDIGRLSRATYQERHDRIQTAETAFLAYIWTMMSFTLALGLIVFFGSTYIVRVLHRRAEAHRERTERVEAELRQLSSELFQTQEQERKVLSRELHDEVGQTLTALSMELGNIGRVHRAGTGRLLEHLNEATRLTHETMKTVRRLAMGLRPAMLDDSGLEPALRYQAREFSRRSGIRVDLQVSGELASFPDPYRTCLYRVVQEALTNCARHANAEQIEISLATMPGGLCLQIKDDGVGLSDGMATGIGLKGIEERVRELDGAVSICSRTSGGTTLRIELPIAKDEVREGVPNRSC
jgi:signal transduction histidine kinase